MRILFVSEEHAAAKGTGGVGSYVATITKALAQRGHDVHVLSCVTDGGPADSVVEGVHLHTRPLVRARGLARVLRGKKTRHALLLALSNYVYARRLGRFDVVESPDWRAEGLFFALLKTTPIVTHLHTPTHVLMAYNDEHLDRDSRWLSRLERTSARRSTRVTCPAHLLVQELRRQGWLTRHVDIIRYPVDGSRFAAATDADRRPASILFVGRLERRKAPERLVQALAHLRRAGVAAEATFVGRGSGARDGKDYGAWVREQAESLGVTCSFVGETRWADIPQLYAETSVVCVPSEFESFSMAVVEGMATGRPVVATDHVGATELFSGGDPYGQVTRRDDDDVAKALLPLLTDPDLAASAGAANRQLVASACDPATIAEQRERLFMEIAR